MALMIIQPPLRFDPLADARQIGAAASMVENEDGGQVFLHGNRHWAWDAVDDAMRRMVAV